jgi:DNA-binding NarL/FixJ family response regulator
LEDAVTDTQPSVLVLGEGIDYALLVRLGARSTGPGVVFIAQEQTLLWSALKAVGVRCIALSTAMSELVAAVRCAADCEPMSQGDNGSRGAPSIGSEADLLTARESEVLRYLREDPPLKYAEIALKMDLAESTVKTYAARLRRKLGVKSKLELSASRSPVA